MNIIETKDLTKIYGEGYATVYALNGINLTINEGEFSAIIGPSGSGKSTLLNLIGGLDIPTSGEVKLASTSIIKMPPNELSDFRRDHIGFIFQAYNLIPVLTVNENIEYVMLLQHIPKDIRRERVNAILKEVGLEGKGDRRPSQLSGGQQQRVAVARAIVSKPKIILADEPTANLDSKTGADLLDMMKELNLKSKITFLFSTHDPQIMERAKRLIRITDGRIESDVFV